MKGVDVLVISDNELVRQQLSSLITSAGYDAITISSIEQMYFLPISQDFDVCVFQSNSVEDPSSHIRKVSKQYPSIQMILVSHQTSIQSIMRASREGCFWVLQDPFENEDLLYLIARGFIASSLVKENHSLRAVLGDSCTTNELVTHSDSMKHLGQRLRKMTPLDASVLLTGESGTGKTFIASFIHKHSARVNKPFITINCANLPKDLLESELFGFERGAFTGATQSRAGTIELCDGGTLFLDEIGELPIDLQPKLLTFLQDKQIRRLGGKTSKAVDVRIICATNRDLEVAITKGIFRADLYYRVNVLGLKIPSLRERKEDILQIADNVLLRIAERRGLNKTWILTDAAREALINYDWPGNIRELEHTLEQATAFAETLRIDTDELSIKKSNSSTNTSEICPLGLSLKEVEVRYIKATLEQFQGDKQKAAESLLISLKTIYNKLQP